MNVISVKVNGIVYNLKGEEQPEYLQKVAGYADRKIMEILDRNSMLDISSAAVLSAINIVDELFKCKAECSELKDSQKTYEDLLEQKEEEISRLKNELAALGDMLQGYAEENNRLNNENKEIKLHLQTYKYKVHDLQDKLMEAQINYVKEKKFKSIPTK